MVAADFHGDRRAFGCFLSEIKKEKPDVSIICGDITHFGTLGEYDEILSSFEKEDFTLLVVPGNCDSRKSVVYESGRIRSIHGKHLSIDNTEFLGVGGSQITPFDTPFELSEDEIMRILDKGFAGIDGNQPLDLVSHTPPKNTSADRISDGSHVGSVSIRRFVDEKEPSIVFCGHIHESKSTGRIGRSIIVNPGAAKDGYFVVVIVGKETIINEKSFIFEH